jgi:MFS superfamily sulfate permease-like transporter
MMIAIGIALAEFIWDGWRPHYAVLGQPEGMRGYHDLQRYPRGRRIPGLVLFRWDAPLFFANAEMFRATVMEAVVSAPTPAQWLIVAAEPVTSIDVTSVDMLTELDDLLRQAGIELGFAEMKDPVKDELKRFGVFKKLGEHTFFNTIDEAVEAFQKTHPGSESDRPIRQTRTVS